jgi:hypothetical protein
LLMLTTASAETARHIHGSTLLLMSGSNLKCIDGPRPLELGDGGLAASGDEVEHASKVVVDRRVRRADGHVARVDSASSRADFRRTVR